AGDLARIVQGLGAAAVAPQGADVAHRRAVPEERVLSAGGGGARARDLVRSVGGTGAASAAPQGAEVAHRRTVPKERVLIAGGGGARACDPAGSAEASAEAGVAPQGAGVQGCDVCDETQLRTQRRRRLSQRLGGVQTGGGAEHQRGQKGETRHVCASSTRGQAKNDRSGE